MFFTALVILIQMKPFELESLELDQQQGEEQD
jgi:hypothetical protein